MGILRVVFIGMWYAVPGDSWLQVAAYFLMMLNLPELIVVKAVGVSPRSPLWPWMACLFGSLWELSLDVCYCQAACRTEHSELGICPSDDFA